MLWNITNYFDCPKDIRQDPIWQGIGTIRIKLRNFLEIKRIEVVSQLFCKTTLRTQTMDK